MIVGLIVVTLSIGLIGGLLHFFNQVDCNDTSKMNQIMLADKGD